jgi:hypothetical protein
MRDNPVDRLFSLFTSPDWAEAIAGDLAEEREQHGGIWFWLHVARTTLALWRNTLTDAPVVVLIVALAGCALWTTPAIGGAAALYMFPHAIASPVGWIVLAFCWWGGALWTGAVLVGIAPQRGMAACTLLALAGEVLLIWLGATVWRGPLETDFVLFYTTGLFVAAPLLTGGALARRRVLARGIRAVEAVR